MMIKIRVFLLLCFALFLCPETQAQEKERITRFDVALKVLENRSISVTENIDVYAGGRVIKRGITRSLPMYRDMQGRRMKMRYHIKSIEKNGQAESWEEGEHGTDKVLYIGKSNVFLKPGHYSYRIQYTVRDQIGMFEDFDEIYWNAIGTNVRFEIDNASCQIELPKGSSVLETDAYVGRFGSQSKDFDFERNENRLMFRTTRSLEKREGFTVAASFPKGFVKPPNIFERLGTLLFIILGTCLLIPYYIYTWWKYGIDPPTPASYPVFESPDKLSPAANGYIYKNRYKRNNLTASVINLAVKGFLKIEENENKVLFFSSKSYDLTKLKDDYNNLPPEEAQLMRSLFAGRDVAHIDGEYHSYIASAQSMHKSSLIDQYHDFVTKGNNAHMLIIPLLGTSLIFVISVLLLNYYPDFDGINFRALLFFIPAAIIIFFAYQYFIKKPTEERLDLEARIKGFRMYLEVAEKDRLRLLNPPSFTPEHFEQMLPFAFALGVEHEWSEKFEKILADMNYKPQWCNTPVIYFSSHFNSDFTRTALRSATKPSSDGSGGGFSGSGGGGFAGGGGGGGGVGGW